MASRPGANLYRKLIPAVTAAGHRAVAPDYFGFGRSDKPMEDALYIFDFHRNAPIALVEQLELKNITLAARTGVGF
jgi:haloalkane dehalogenase